MSSYPQIDPAVLALGAIPADGGEDMWGPEEEWSASEAPRLRAVPDFPPRPPDVDTPRTWDDLGNAQRLIDRYGPIVRWTLVKKGGEWAVYDGRRWAFHGGDTLVRTLVREMVEHLPNSEALAYSDEPDSYDKDGNAKPSMRDRFLGFVAKLRDHRVMGRAVSAATTFPELHARAGDFDANRRYLNLPNGVLDTDNVKLLAHNPDLMLSKMFGVPYNPQVKAPTWERFLSMNIPDEATRLYLQKAAGYTLSGLSNEKTLLYLYGPSDTGKSIFTGVMSRIFGEYGLVASDGALRPRREGTINNDVDDMAGMRFVTTSESRPGEEMDEALVKRLTGRDDQRTRQLYERNRTWTPECVIWVCSNQYPKITGDDDAIWTRIRVVPFLRQFLAGDPDRDERLEEKLHAEMEGIFAWAVRGLQLYLREGLAPPPEVIQAGERFRSTADGVTAFVAEYTEDEFLTIEEGGWAPRTELYEMYKRWCKESAMREPLRPSRFYARLEVSYRPAKVNGTRGFAGITVGPKQMAPAGWGR